MRKTLISILVPLFLPLYISTQQVIENPDKPISQSACRSIELKEVLSIDDVGSDYYFKSPRNPKVAPDGSIFISDHEQLLQFDRDGNFLRNYFKKGQGPEEMQSVGNYFFTDNNIHIHDRRLQKILLFSLDGTYINEFRIHELPSHSRLYHFHNDSYYFIGYSIPPTEGKPSVIDVPYKLFSVMNKGQEVEKLTSFPVESFALKAGRGGAMASIAEMTVTPYQDNYLVLCHTQDYLLKIYDIESKKLIRSFKRKYKRVEIPKGREARAAIGIAGKMYTAPGDYLNDITKILVFRDLIWVMTSTTDEKKGVLIDVFDFKGRYIDNFYMKIPGKINPIFIGYTPMTISGDFLYVRVKNEDETYSIKKYLMDLNQK